ncbi:hypothetical protein GCM10009116_01570 [Brevundimonas basaltis]|uniref:Sensory/regulatory protein RpfC n=1 Tax=Brevundimonas basaltis TaxID=472166 RepID=A0A7W8HZM5_9CAUL|nr:PAS domain-containing protein [Brevundimonas basaltis]MBB5292821.1 PAS domain S-box-containing protein [Brevundimonas basaltis]
MATTSEAERLAALQGYQALDTSAEDRFDRISAMAAAQFQAPIALVSLIDTERQWFKSCIGLGVSETPREFAFCDHAIRLEDHAVLVVEDARADPRFADNPLVTGDPFIRFYCGAVLTTAEGCNLGTLCVIDTEPRPQPSAAEIGHLQSLARLVVDQLELTRARAEFAEQRRLLEFAATMSQVGHWKFDFITGKVTWSDEVFRIHGLPSDEPVPPYEVLQTFYVEEDRPVLTALVDRAIATGEGYEFKLRIRNTRGEIRHTSAKAECIRDGSGKPVAMFGVFQDITDQHNAETVIRESERRYRLLAENASDVIATYSPDGAFRYVSPSITEMLGYLPEDLIGREPYEIILPEDHARVAAEFIRASTAHESFTVEYRALTSSGEVRWLEARPRFQRDKAGRIIEINDSVRDVTDRHEREAALAEARAAAESAVRAKAEFLANMSHEIRTPLNGVLGFTDLLAGTELTGEQARFVSRIRSAGRGLSALIDDILDLSKVEAGKMTVARRGFDLHALTDDVIQLARRGTEKPLTFTLVYPADAPRWIIGDEQRTRQVLFNLLGNAAKFTEEGEVRLDVDFSGARLELRVTDTGIGIAPEDLLRLFQGFTQADASIGRQFGGTGLGLSISRNLARLMGGDVELESKPGKGTIARFTLPAEVTTAPELPVQPAGAPANPPRALRILAVDDVDTNVELITLILQSEGHDVVGARSGERALDILADDPRFDLILMDVQMPGMDGLKATRAIRELGGAAATVPVVALTANVMSEQIADCRAAGMDDHLAKPIQRESLADVLDRVRGGGWDPAPPASDPIAELGARYRVHLGDLAGQFTALLERAEPERRTSIASLAHSIAGTAGSFGFDAVSTAAFELESATRIGAERNGSPDRIASLVSQLQRAIFSCQEDA